MMFCVSPARYILIVLAFLSSTSLTAQCRKYIPQAGMFNKSNWSDKRPASECETQFAKSNFDSLRAAFAGFDSYKFPWMRLVEPDTNKKFYALRIPEDMNDDREILVKDYFQVIPGTERTLFDADPSFHYHIRMTEDLPEYAEVNKARMKYRTDLAALMKNNPNRTITPEMSKIIRDMALADVDFWMDKSFLVSTYLNRGLTYDSDLQLSVKGKVDVSRQDDSMWVVHVTKNREVDPGTIIDGNFKTEDLIDDWYYLVGNWAEPVITTDSGITTVVSQRRQVMWGDKKPADFLSNHYILVKITAGEKLKDEVVKNIRWETLKRMLYNKDL